jgi:ABC-type phosphate transport system permease subunit
MRTLLSIIATIIATPFAIACKVLLWWTERKQSKIEQYEDEL